MCSRGDIIVVASYKSEGKEIKRHSFVVIDDDGGQIQGLDFDFISLVMSSVGNDEKRERKLRYPGNFPIAPEDQKIEKGGNNKYGYIKAEQFYYFNKEKTNYKRIGQLTPEIYELLIEFIETEMDTPIIHIKDNL